ncbi:unnamed protein product [Paramecium octaurelia]|uniref:Uncharacterized protein n=1 Tax=Paramecium octaurelia TaxID=43137 RepID=A0A8S1T3J3_PAROT|nr:unnamed protein product [Paramecium octaurelia]
MKHTKTFAYKFNGKHLNDNTSTNKKVSIAVIKQLYLNLEDHQDDKIQNIQKSICDSQNQVYYSMYLIKQMHKELKDEQIEIELQKLDVPKILEFIVKDDPEKLDPVKYLQKLNENQLSQIGVPETLQELIKNSPQKLDLAEYLKKLNEEELLSLGVHQILCKWIKDEKQKFVFVKCLQKLNKDEKKYLGIPKILQKWIKDDPSRFDLVNYFQKLNDQQLSQLDVPITLYELIKNKPQQLNLVKYLQKLKDDELSQLEVPKILYKRNKDDQQKLNNNESFKKRRANITFSQYCFVEKQFLNKLNEFKFYKDTQLRQMAQWLKDKYQKALTFLDDLTDRDNQELRQQLFQLYSIFNQYLFQNNFGLILLQQNFHPQYNQLQHCTSIIQSMFCQDYEKNIILDFPKFAYISLTGHESQDNLYFFQDFNSYYKNFYLYFSIYNGKTHKGFKECNRSTTIPYYNEVNIISEFEMKFIFNNHIKNKLIQFKPTIIYVHVQNNEKFSINLTALTKFIRKLKKICTVVIYIKYDVESENLENSTLEFMRTVNACLFGLSGIQCRTQKTLIQLDQDIESIKVIIESLNQVQLKNYMHIQLFFLKKQLQKLIDLQNQHKIVLMGNNKNYIIEYKDKQDIKIEFERLVISYQHNIIILLDFKSQQFYYHHFQNLQEENNFQGEQNQFQNIKIKFNKFKENKYIQGKMLNAVVIINQSQILFACPLFENLKQDEMDVIWVYSLDNNNWDSIKREHDNNEQYNDKYFEQPIETPDKISDKQQKIVGQTVCYQPHIQQNFKGYDIYSLFGGELIDSFKPVNSIQYLFVNVEKKVFYSKFIRRSLNPFKGSLKPSPYQLVLPIKNINQFEIIECAYLILRPWNQTKNNYYETMLNPSNATKAQLVIFLKKSQSTIFLDIAYKISKNSKYYLNILDMMNQDVNWMEIQGQVEKNSQINKWQWKAVFTNFIKFKNWKRINKNQNQKENTKNKGQNKEIEGQVKDNQKPYIGLNQEKKKNIPQDEKQRKAIPIHHNISNGTIVSLQFTITLKYYEDENFNQGTGLESLPFTNKDWLVETDISRDWIYKQGE